MRRQRTLTDRAGWSADDGNIAVDHDHRRYRQTVTIPPAIPFYLICS
jgi:hypothetical protein